MSKYVIKKSIFVEREGKAVKIARATSGEEPRVEELTAEEAKPHVKAKAIEKV